MSLTDPTFNYQLLAEQIKKHGIELGFQQVGITDTDLTEAENHLNNWLAKKHHGNMDYLAKHGSIRSHPDELHKGTIRVISLRLNYLPAKETFDQVQTDPTAAFISRYALGRDYHKMMRKRLKKLTQFIESKTGVFSHRVFVDSAPVLEKALAEKAGLGWIGKHTNLINREAGSWFFIGEIYIDLPLPTDTAVDEHCGDCTACIDICPTQAIIGPYQLDARRCISYLTIELNDSIPVEFRKAIGNHIYGCDDCQIICPWNKFSTVTTESDFLPRHHLDTATLIELFNWSEEEFLKRLEGSAIRRIGYQKWLRNIAIALGNAPKSAKTKAILVNKLLNTEPMVKEHIQWAIKEQEITN